LRVNGNAAGFSELRVVIRPISIAARARTSPKIDILR